MNTKRRLRSVMIMTIFLLPCTAVVATAADVVWLIEEARRRRMLERLNTPQTL